MGGIGSGVRVVGLGSGVGARLDGGVGGGVQHDGLVERCALPERERRLGVLHHLDLVGVRLRLRVRG